MLSTKEVKIQIKISEINFKLERKGELVKVLDMAIHTLTDVRKQYKDV